MNACYVFVTTVNKEIVVLANYAHIVPIVLSIFLGLLILFKSKRTLFLWTFFFFIIAFSLWLLGDLITWTSTNYYLIYAVWSILDYLEILFFALGLYFAAMFTKKSDVSFVSKALIFLATLVPLAITVTGHSVAGFNEPQCEAFNSNFLGNYKLAFETIVLVILLTLAIAPVFKKSSALERRSNIVVLGSMFLFLAIFGMTEYLASVTGYYEMNLYSLFLLPVFLVAIIYSVFELDIFNFKILGTHYLVVALVILTSGQLFFIHDAAYRLVTGLTIGLTIALGIVLFRNLRRESEQRVHIENLNENLRALIKQRESLVHLVTHKVKGSFTRTKFIFAGILDGSFGAITPDIQKVAEQGLEFDNGGIQTVDLVLNAANLENGLIKYDMKTLDFRDIVLRTAEDKKLQIEAKNLKLEMHIPDNGSWNVVGDAFWLKEAVANLIDNSIKYTREGMIALRLERKGAQAVLSVSDTGIGITDEDKKNLFTEGGRGKDSVKVNVDSTGYGLYTVKLVISAHRGTVHAESPGPGQGSTFFVELPLA